MKEKYDWDTFPHQYIPAANASCGFHGILLAMIEYYGPGKNVLLLSEPPDVLPVFQERFPQTSFEITSYSGRLCEEYEFDLNIFTPSEKKYDIVFSQATLEHISRPSIAIENMVERCYVGGFVIIHTHGPECPLHRFPIDCVRFLRDFYFDLEKYIPARVEAFSEVGVHQFIVYTRIKKEEAIN